MTLRLARAGVYLEIVNGGKAFDVDLLSSPKWSIRLAFTGMRERVEMVHGVFSIVSTPGKGTTIQTVIPVVNSKRGKYLATSIEPVIGSGMPTKIPRLGRHGIMGRMQ